MTDAGAPRTSTETVDEGPVLEVDAATLVDLGVFPAAEGETSLFGFCDRTRTRGGSAALRRRMRRPSADPARIRATQQAVECIGARRAIFEALPSAYLLERVDRYLHAPAPLITQTAPLEFALAGAGLWANDFRSYASIVHGVQLALRLLQTLRTFAAQPGLDASTGELAPIVEETRALLDQTGLAEASAPPVGFQPWHRLRVDQLLRLQEKDAVLRLIELVHELDALVALADVAAQDGFHLPEIADGPLRIEAEELGHALVPGGVGNPVRLDQDQRLLFLTGPNMAGKTTYLRSVATAFYLAHLGTGVPARRFSFVPADQLFSAISLHDDLQGGISYFRAEALRVKEIARAVADGRRVVAVLDEPFKGTNVKDALDACEALLRRFAEREGSLFLVSSHLIELEAVLASTGAVDARHFEADEAGSRLHFDYRLRDGVSTQRLGMRVLREEGVFELLDAPADVPGSGAGEG